MTKKPATVIQNCTFTNDVEPYENVIARAEAVIELAKALRMAAEALTYSNTRSAPMIRID